MSRSDNVEELRDDEIFVFGSNLSGIHGAGAAYSALKWGAKIGKGIGICGMTYAIPTKDENIQTLPLSRIKDYIIDFIEYAKNNPHLKFLVTKIGCGLAGYTEKDIAPLFHEANNIRNIILPSGW